MEKIYSSGMKVRRRDTRIWFVGLGVFVMVFLFTFFNGYFESGKKDVDAASVENFDPGYIISDYQMGNYNSMSESEIQAFLTAKNPCDNRDASWYNSLVASSPASYSWHFENGHFVCLSEELFGDGEVIGSGETAAHIIWQAAQDYKINPQVLIVLLQKEQGLITDTYPHNRQYRSATGYGCPDTAPCAEQYYGFKNQVRKAAALFRTVLDGGWTNYPLGENYIQYNPSVSCGGSVVNIRSLATSALYRYTPYQPNAGALAAGYGTAYCGAYGNRNFYLYFEDWFGGITGEGIVFETADYSGTYTIYYYGNKNKTISIGSDNNVEALVKEDKMQWQIEKIEDYYIITNKATGKALDVSGGVFGNKVNVWQYNVNKTCAQRWNFVKNNDNTFTIHSACYPQYVLDLADGNANIQVYKKTDYENDHQKWEMKPAMAMDVKEGMYRIYTADYNKSVGVEGDNLSVGGNVLVDILSNVEKSHIFKITKINDKYQIKVKDADLYLGVKDKEIENNSNVVLCNKSDDCKINWYFEKNGDGYFLRSADNVIFALDLQDGLSNVQAYRRIEDNDHQKWYLCNIDEGDYSGLYNLIYFGDSEKKFGLAKTEAENGINIETVTLPAFLTSVQWQIEKIEDYYIITNKATGKALDVSGGVFGNKVNVWQYNVNKTCAQRWNFVKNNDNTFTIHSACYPQYVLDLADGNANIQVYKKTDYENDHQKWEMKPVDKTDYSGTYTIYYYGNKNKTISIGSDNNVEALVKEDKMQWQIEKIEDYYIITNKATGKALDVSGGVFGNKVNVWQYNVNKTCAQRWNFVKNNDNTFTIHSACYPQYVLDLADGNANIQVYKKTDYENDHQKWEMKPVGTL